ncbi:hypothetical protein MYX65_04765 [Acidobacteria bacterium AH-259-L09]|nr:hypothetical protein [Acidobacteria bacterium AH-259-L09]
MSKSNETVLCISTPIPLSEESPDLRTYEGCGKHVCGKNAKALMPPADADIVVFNPETIQDLATYELPAQYSRGVKYLLVSGTIVVDDEKLVEGVASGRALVSGRRRR